MLEKIGIKDYIVAGFGWFWKALGDTSGRNQKRSLSIVSQAGKIDVTQKSDDDLRAEIAQTYDEKKILKPALLLSILGEASRRSLGLEPFASQSQAVLRLVEGDVIHMTTGEGKTLVGAMASTALALQGKKVHCITVNDYLASRDAEWMGPLAEFFGLTVAFIQEGMGPQERRQAYQSDILYGSINELGFDVLRDQLITRREDAVACLADVAIVDEADSVLVDEALVPLVLAGNEPGRSPSGKITDIVRTFVKDEDYVTDSDRRNVFLTDQGTRRVEAALGVSSLYEQDMADTLVQVNLALHAKELLIRDVHYIVRDGKIQLIDASRGRVADLQRWPDGLQAAVEAKEGLAVTEGGRILDTITIQALMKRYPMVCGMTGTAVEAVDQLRQFYDLRVSVIEPNKPCQRVDLQDRVYATMAEKNKALVSYIREVHATGQPILVGTHDVEESEELARELRSFDLELSVLNAKNDREEAGIIANAGRLNHITVSTQMAGRGTDIRLGGENEEEYDAVVERGGLCVIGTGRYRTSRLDNQLRGRAGRQGDPGTSIFFVSLEDDVVRTGGAGEEVLAQPDDTGLIDSKRVYNFIDHCQRVTEGQLLEIHAQTWKYNKLLADQRVIIDQRRATILDTDTAWLELSSRVPSKAEQLMHLDESVRVQACRDIMLYHLDYAWSEHLALLDDVRESIHLRAIAKETPIDEFHRIAVHEFKELGQRAIENSIETFTTVLIDESGAHLTDLGLARPTATWTYMVNDNPLAGNGNSVIGAIGSIFK